MFPPAPLIFATLIAAIAGILDWRYRRIPNWLTVSGAVGGLVIHTILYGWTGFKSGFLGLLLGLGLLLPFVLVRSLGAGDWKLAGSLGACLGPHGLLAVLFAAILVAGAMALIVVIAKGRLWTTFRNIAHMLGAMLSLRLPGQEVSLDNPQSTKIPFGVALALATVLYVVGVVTGRVQG